MKYKINSVFIIISVIIGILFGVANEFMPIYQDWFLGVLPVVIVMAAFALIMGVVLIIRGFASSAFVYAGKTIALALVFIIAFIGFTGLFELLYEVKTDVEITPGSTTTQVNINNATTQTPGGSNNNYNSNGTGGGTNSTTTVNTVTTTGYTTAGTYVFLIDNSDSMNHPTLGNDIEGKRFDAVDKAVNSLNNNAEVYVYAFGTDCMRDSFFAAKPTYQFVSNRNIAVGGETYLLSAMDEIIDTVTKNNVYTNIIVLTDGQPNDEDIYDDVVDKCKKNKVHVSCVGFGDADRAFLEKLANDTKGAWAFSTDVNDLIYDVGRVVEYTTTTQVPNNNQNTSSNNYYPGTTNNQTTVNTQTTVNPGSISTTKTAIGNLLGRRFAPSIMHLFLRILFLVILGLIWSLAKALLVGDTQFNLKLAIITFIVASLGAVVLEVILLIGLPSALARIFFFATWALTIVPEYYDDYKGGSNVDLGGYKPLETNAASDLWNTPKNPGDANTFL